MLETRPLVIGKGFPTPVEIRRQGDKNFTEKTVSHTFCCVLQRWQIYPNIALLSKPKGVKFKLSNAH